VPPPVPGPVVAPGPAGLPPPLPLPLLLPLPSSGSPICPSQEDSSKRKVSAADVALTRDPDATGIQDFMCRSCAPGSTDEVV